MNTFLLFFFGTLIGVASFSMVKIQRAEYFAAREKKAKERACIDAFRAKCCRPDGD